MATTPSSYLVLHNIFSKTNIGNMLRSASAMGVTEVIIVGLKKYNTFGAHGADRHVKVKNFQTLQEARQYLKEQGCNIVGIEIMPDAKPIQSHPFTGSTAFVMGNEGTGLSQKQIEMCDDFVYIPQHGGGTASLNVCVATTIVLHHFAMWGQFPERAR
eukprot:Colp12_sorted_trinity150504_noHs@30115